MKRSMMFAVVALGIVVTSASAQGGLGLCLKPGFIINAAHIGYQSDKLFIGGGLEFASASWSSSYEHTSHDTWGGQETTYTSKGSDKLDVSVFLPQVAAKAFLGSVGEASEAGYARPYLWGSLFYSLAMAKATSSYNDSTFHDTLTERNVRDLLGGNLGGALAFGGEYFIARSLSLSGEFGARFFFGDTKEESHYNSYYGDDIYKNTAKLGLGFTYTTLGLNFYF